MFSRLVKLFRACPLTWIMLFVCPLLWVFDIALSIRLDISYQDASRLLGAEDEFALWDGQWWRIITTAFHHGGLVHLLCNMSFLGLAGRLLEHRLGSFKYCLFSVAAILVSGAVQTFWGGYVGLSGLLFAQFGLIWGWRRFDPWWKEQISNQSIQWGLIWFFACFVVSWLGIFPIGNAAHTAGLAYGWLVAVTRFGTPRERLGWPIFLSSHAFLLPCLYFLVHPVWNGKYHWRRGDLAQNSVDEIRHYENALRCDPDLDGPAINLALIHARQHKFLVAWKIIIQGLSRNPSSQKVIQLAREIARNLIGPENRSKARQILDETFGAHAATWEAALFTEVPIEELKQLDLPEFARHRPDAELPGGKMEEPLLPELPTTLPRRALDETPRPARKLPPPDPNAPGSAEEGRAA